MNKSTFLKSFEMEFEIPSICIIDADICPTNVDTQFQLIKYILPKENAYKIATQSNFSRDPDICKSYQELYKKYDGNIVMRHITTEHLDQ